MSVENFISGLGLEFGLELELNENGVASITVDDKFEIEFEYVDSLDTLFVSTPLGKLEGGGNEKIYKAFLDANLYGKKTGGAVFALDDHTNEVMLFFQVVVGKNEYQEFRIMMERYLNTLIDWSVKFEELLQKSISEPDGYGLKEMALNVNAIRV